MTAKVGEQGGSQSGLGPGKGPSSSRAIYNPHPDLTARLFWQGLLVSVLYCFINKEVGRAPPRRPRPLAAAQGTARLALPLSAIRLQVQSEVRRGWHRCRLRRSLSEEQRQPPERASGSLPLGFGVGQVATGRVPSSGTLPGPGDAAASPVLESYC